MAEQKVEERRTLTPWWVCDGIADTSTDTFAITGGLGSGKTTGSAMWFIDRWLLNQKSQFSWAVAPTHTKIEQILLPAVRQVLFDVYGMVEDVHYRIYKGRFFKLVARGYPHEIHFLSGDRPGLFVGSNVACLWVTEPGLMVREVFEKGQTRLRCPRAVVRQTILEGTPEGLSGKGAWWAEIADVPGAGFDRRGTSGPQKGVRRFIAETTHNRHLKPSPEEYAQKKIRDVFAYDKNKILSYEKGLFVPFTKGSAYWEWVESRNVALDHVKPSVHLPLILTFDFNVAPLSWVTMQEFTVQRNYYSPMTKQFVVLNEASGEARGLMDAVAEFGAHYPVETWGHVPIHVYGDPTGFARNIHNSSADNFQAIANYLWNLGYRKVEILASSEQIQVQHRLEKTAALMVYERVVVNATCRKLIASFARTALREGTWEIEKPGKEDWTHWADACTYALFQIAKDIDVANPHARRVFGAN